MLYRQHYEQVATYIYRRLGDRQVTEDLTAEVFLTALRTLPRYRYRGVPIRVWFYRLARCVTMSEILKRTRYRLQDLRF